MNDRKHDEYLAKALEAEKLAKQADDPDVRESWLKIAKSYRNLARHLDS